VFGRGDAIVGRARRDRWLSSGAATWSPSTTATARSGEGGTTFLPLVKSGLRRVRAVLCSVDLGALICPNAGLQQGTHQFADRGGHAFVDAVVVALEELE